MSYAGIHRISDQMRSNTLLDNIRRNTLQTALVQQQLATGNRLLTPSDDPAAANSALSVQRSMEQLEQTLANLQKAGNLFAMTDSALGDAATLLTEAQTLASASVGSTITAEEKVQAAGLINEITHQMLSLANSQLGDVYIFGGTATTEAPFLSTPGGVRYIGADQNTMSLLGEPSASPVGLTGQEVFGALSCRVSGYQDLTPQMSVNTRLADLRGAGEEGVRLNTIQITDGTNDIEVDLTAADRVGDVIAIINAAGGGVITAALGPANNFTISSSAGGADLVVTDIEGSQAARDLGIYRPTGQGATFNGDSVLPAVTATTQLADLVGGAGVDLTSGLIITNGQESATLDFSTDTTVEDLLNRINSAGVNVVARINADGTGIDVINTFSETELRIGENGGTTADDLGIRSFRGATTLDELNDGIGIHTVDGETDIRVNARDGSFFEVDLDGITDVDDVISSINTAAGIAGVAVSAALAATSNGIELTDATGGVANLEVVSTNSSTAAAELGLLQSVSANTLTGDDVNPIVPDSVFAHLAQLRDALLRGDDTWITLSTERLKDDFDHMVAQRARVGGLTRNVETRAERAEDQQTSNQATLSLLKDADYVEAVTRFQALQTALQANLITGSKMMSLSLLDFLR